MYSVAEDPASYTVFDAIRDLLMIKPVFALGLLPICAVLLILFRRHPTLPKIRISVSSLVFYYYLCMMLTHVVGIPTLREYIRLTGLGETFFHPNLNLIPLVDGVSISFILNIALFVPLGFLCPLISRYYRSLKHALLLGFGLSLSIEIVQLVTLYRVTDVDDLLTNLFGALIGYLFFRVIHRPAGKRECAAAVEEPRGTRYLPVMLIVLAFVLGFFS